MIATAGELTKNLITLCEQTKHAFFNRVKPYVNSVFCDRAKEPACAAEPDCDVNTLKNCTALMKVAREKE